MPCFSASLLNAFTLRSHLSDSVQQQLWICELAGLACIGVESGVCRSSGRGEEQC